MRRFWVWIVLLTLLMPVSAAYAQKSYHAQRFDVDVVVEENGSLLVTETVTFAFVGDPFTFVFREIPTDLTDGLQIISAEVDGRSYQPGVNAGQVEIEQGNPVRVTWHMEPTANDARTFTLTYRLLGVVQQTETADLLLYQPLPDSYEYTIDSSTVTVRFPETAVLADTPRVQAGTADVAASGSQVTFTGRNLEPNETLVVALPFAPGSLITAPPTWQANRATRLANQQAAMPYWLSAAGVILLTGIFFTSRSFRKYQIAAPTQPPLTYEPPSPLAPALAGALQANGLEPNWDHGLATMFDLAGRGLLEIEERPKTKWYQSQDFIVRQLTTPSDALPHEEALLDLIFLDKKGRPSQEVLLSDLTQRVTSKRWKAFQDVVKMELAQAGWISQERKQARRRLFVWGGVGFVFSFLALIPTVPLNDQFGLWPLTIAGALFVVGLVAIILGSGIRPLTETGARIADEWLGFKEYLKQVSKGKAAMTRPDMFDLYLPLAAAFGHLYPWAKRLEKEGWQKVPAYFRSLTANDMGAFVAVIAASSSSGGAAGAGAGAAGAGAAGGGASGAG